MTIATVAPTQDAQDSGHRTWYLSTPISREDIADIRIGDIVFLDGHIVTCRDVAHRRLIEYGRELPVDLRDGAILHAGPITRRSEDSASGYEMVSVGPTTSMRMEKFEYDFIRDTGVRLIVGKGGMGSNTERGCAEFGALHCVFPAGNAVIAATEVDEIEDVHWTELGMPESLWVNRVTGFGPLIVSIDATGANLFEQQKVIYNERKEAALKKLYDKVRFIK
ncbi:L(+)-tartrate dehydratase subunit beta [Corynebacterium uberis]|uniref:L(+)-tartrate dehydratase subunit beta n=1 Tax=Corynebacterium TaxID=1716 RepID=UPI001D0B84FC|nr:L(+)-tartrate dehydratase subunit beta [Corynebacterium uberis]MCZ9309298.1 L(+)-tartrate dehydratase subunit beta [Corynebacterium sp. c6VSa_13]UDL72851.1 L(+)-tartrate dehydratase subunit beta [Corynebacterium uberis]UDL76271.1 L(+)-tartrate dehydratase subunit beta [Corynebacterium uberis]UDL78484.1 L(+)-tartrate dehydratase subunit beta [Corynebacterium uberis]UDL80766.1 L(+)-tartrate dehydratase subunit beta [Corynebacterium uberis]